MKGAHQGSLSHTLNLFPAGTANGGSALLWAGVMELAGLENSKIITIDVVPPVWKEGQEGWGGGLIAREDPTQNKHWKKRVTFIEVRAGL